MALKEKKKIEIDLSDKEDFAVVEGLNYDIQSTRDAMSNVTMMYPDEDLTKNVTYNTLREELKKFNMEFDTAKNVVLEKYINPALIEKGINPENAQYLLNFFKGIAEITYTEWLRYEKKIWTIYWFFR